MRKCKHPNGVNMDIKDLTVADLERFIKHKHCSPCSVCGGLVHTFVISPENHKIVYSRVPFVTLDNDNDDESEGLALPVICTSCGLLQQFLVHIVLKTVDKLNAELSNG